MLPTKYQRSSTNISINQTHTRTRGRPTFAILRLHSPSNRQYGAFDNDDESSHDEGSYGDSRRKGSNQQRGSGSSLNASPASRRQEGSMYSPSIPAMVSTHSRTNSVKLQEVRLGESPKTKRQLSPHAKSDGTSSPKFQKTDYSSVEYGSGHTRQDSQGHNPGQRQHTPTQFVEISPMSSQGEFLPSVPSLSLMMSPSPQMQQEQQKQQQQQPSHIVQKQQTKGQVSQHPGSHYEQRMQLDQSRGTSQHIYSQMLTQHSGMEAQGHLHSEQQQQQQQQQQQHHQHQQHQAPLLHMLPMVLGAHGGPHDLQTAGQTPMGPPLTVPNAHMSNNEVQLPHRTHQQPQIRYTQPLLPIGTTNHGSRILLPGEITPDSATAAQSPGGFASVMYGHHGGMGGIGTNIPMPRISTDVGTLFYNWNTGEPGLSPATSFNLSQLQQQAGQANTAGSFDAYSPTTVQWYTL